MPNYYPLYNSMGSLGGLGYNPTIGRGDPQGNFIPVGQTMSAPQHQQDIQNQISPGIIQELQRRAAMQQYGHNLTVPMTSPQANHNGGVMARPYMGPNAVDAARMQMPQFGGTTNPRQAALAAYNMPQFRPPMGDNRAPVAGMGMGGFNPRAQMAAQYAPPAPPPGPTPAVRGTNPNPHALGGGLIGV